MTSSTDDGQPDGSTELPVDPQARPQETVEALEQGEPSPDTDEDTVPAEDVAENPETDELEGLPGPSADEPSEPAG